VRDDYEGQYILRILILCFPEFTPSVGFPLSGFHPNVVTAEAQGLSRKGNHEQRDLPMSSSRQRAADFGIYVVIALACAAGLVWYASASGTDGADSLGRWGGLAINTILLYGFVVKQSREMWHLYSFWLPFAVLLALHIALFSVILVAFSTWRVLWFLAMYPIELPIIAVICDWSVEKFGESRRE